LEITPKPSASWPLCAICMRGRLRRMPALRVRSERARFFRARCIVKTREIL
jgi:hypothetical protein